MARIRSVKPEFWTDEDLSVVSRDARLLYIGLWNLSDEHGRLRGDPRYVKGQLFPYDDDLGADGVDELLTELESEGKVVRYRTDGRRYLFVPNLHKHQRLESEKVPSRLPEPPGVGESGQPGDVGADSSVPRADESARGADKSARDNGEVTHGADQEEQAAQIRADKSAPRADKSSLLYVAGSMEHVAGSMGIDGAAAPGADEPRATPAAKSKRASRIPDDFTVTDDMRVWYRDNTPDVDITIETAQFVDHWRGKSRDATKVDWTAAWRTWMRNSQKWKTERASGGRAGNSRTPTGGNRHQPYRDDPTIDYHGAI